MKVSVGQRAERSLTLTKQHVETFAKLTGDYNPLHFDEAFVAKTKFGRLVVQGGLTTGLLHALVAMDMPGPGTCVSESELEVHRTRLHRRHDHRIRRNRQRSRKQAGDAAHDSRHATNRRGCARGRSVVLHI
jgi:acyl dehydratase